MAVNKLFTIRRSINPQLTGNGHENSNDETVHHPSSNATINNASKKFGLESNSTLIFSNFKSHQLFRCIQNFQNMKTFVAFVLALCICIQLHSVQAQIEYTVYRRNLVYNGDFSVGMWRYQLTIYGEGLGWDVGYGEWGKGRDYNPKWGEHDSVAELDVDHNTEYGPIFEYDSGKGTYHISFNWAIRYGFPIKTSQIELRWNNQLFKTLRAYRDEIFTEILMTKTNTSRAYFTLTGAGSSDGAGATITNFKAFKVDPDESKSEAYLQRNSQLNSLNGIKYLLSLRPKRNLMRNGDFEENAAELLGDKQSVVTDKIPHWKVSPHGQLVKNLYDSGYWSDWSHAIQLDIEGSRNVVYRYDFQGTNQRYYIDFEYAPFELIELESSRFSVEFNGRQVVFVQPQTYEVRRRIIEIEGKQGNNYLTFTGRGLSNGKGVTIDNVSIL